MNIQDPEFFKELVAMFKIETTEHVEAIQDGLDKLKGDLSGSENQDVLEVVFRAAHSLKGAARTVGLIDIESIGQELERLLAQVKNGKLELDQRKVVLFKEVTSELQVMIQSLTDDGKITGDSSQLLRRLELVEQEKAQ